jgi:cell wall-associated NlpC family hydrolase
LPTLSARDVAALVKQAGFPSGDQATMVAIAKAESGFRVEARGGPNRNGTYDYGLFQINSVHKYDTGRLTSDAAYNTSCAKKIYDSQGLRAWSTYNAGRHSAFMNEARQAVAQASSVGSGTGSTAATSATTEPSKPAVTYGPPGPQLTLAGVGTPLSAAAEVPGPLTEFKIIGSDIQGDFSAVVIGQPQYEAGWTTVPNLQFTIADPQGDLLWQQRNLWQRGVRVTWRDLDMRIDEITFEPGSHNTGQLTITAIDHIVYALQQLRGERTAGGISAVQWLEGELRLAGLDPARCLLGESVPTQSEIARDVPDANNDDDTSTQNYPSAWTTIQRLAKELGKRCFISGSRIIFGSSGFALAWAAPGDLKIGWHASEPGEQWLRLPSATQTSVGKRHGLTQVKGKIPLNRAVYFRPGASVLVHNTPSIAADQNRQFIVSHVSQELARDSDGVDVQLDEPIDPPAEPPTGQSGVNSGSTSSGTSTSGGGSDGQIDQFVSLCLQQVGDRYVFGAEVKMSDPNPNVFDCSELIEWAASRAGINPKVPDGSSAQINHCRSIPVAQAIRTKGAILWHPGHVAVSLGDGGTVEAQNPQVGVVKSKAGNRFTRGGLIPGAKGYR